MCVEQVRHVGASGATPWRNSPFFNYGVIWNGGGIFYKVLIYKKCRLNKDHEKQVEEERVHKRGPPGVIIRVTLIAIAQTVALPVSLGARATPIAVRMLHLGVRVQLAN